MKRIYLPLLLSALVLGTSARLTFTQRIQKKGSHVQLRQDKDIDRLVNGREADPTTVAPTAASTTPVAKVKPSVPVAPTQTQATKSAVAAAPVQTSPSKPSGYAMRTGWRVKFFSGGSSRVDKENAQATGREFKRLFPDTPVYMHFVAPHWICVAGDFVNREDADVLVRRVRQSGQFANSGLAVVKTKVKVPIE